MDVPLFAVDFGPIIGIIFVIISIASAIFNTAKEKNKPQPGKQKQKAALQVELEKFLHEAMNPKAEKKQKPANVEFLDEDAFKVESPVEQSPKRRRRRQQKSQPTRTQQKKQSTRRTNEPQAVRQKMTHRERAEIKDQDRKERLGRALRERIEQKHQSHVSSNIQGHLSSTVNQQPSGKSGFRDDESTSRTSRSGGAKVIRKLIKDPQSLRQAIILNEILSPPKSLRRS